MREDLKAASDFASGGQGQVQEVHGLMFYGIGLGYGEGDGIRSLGCTGRRDEVDEIRVDAVERGLTLSVSIENVCMERTSMTC